MASGKRIMRYQILLGLVALVSVAACSGEAPAVEPPVGDAENMTVADAPPAATYSFARTEVVPGEPKDILVAELGGQAIEIQAFDYSMGEVALQQDLNGDGTVDAIVSVHGGGNCCPADFFFVADRKDGRFAVTQIPEIYSWDGPVLEDGDGPPAVRFVSMNEGMNTDDYLETRHVFRFEGETPVIVSKSTKEEIDALVEMRSSAFNDGHEGRLSFQYDLNGDGSQDNISCGFWERWGRLNDCEVDLEDGNMPMTIDANCKRLGVLDEVTNEMKDLVCDADQRLTYKTETGQYE